MEEKRREQAIRIKESLIGRNPVWRALRSAARYDFLEVRVATCLISFLLQNIIAKVSCNAIMYMYVCTYINF